MNVRVIPDASTDVLLPQQRYPEIFMMIYQQELCQEGRVQKGGTWRTLRVLEWRSG